MVDRTQRFASLVDGLRGRASADAERAVGAPLAERLESSVQLAEAGEGGVGIENLCENLYEYDVRLTVDEHQALTDLAKEWGVEGSTTEVLALLAPNGG